MYRIGLTGGVGSGKSTVSSYLKELGIPVIDGDKLAREAVTPGSPAMKQMREVFGDHIFLPDGNLDRLQVASIVFTNEKKRQQLNGIIHPYIWHCAQQELFRAQEQGYDIVVLDMPLLLEISWQLRVEEVWIVKVPLEEQIRRVMARDNFTRQQVLDRIHKQMPTENKVNYADVIIDNSRSVEETRRQVDVALEHVRNMIIRSEE